MDLGSSNVVFYPPLSSLVDSNANKLTELANNIDKLINLKTLILNSNKLTSLLNSISNLKNLEVLDLSNNQDLDITKELDKLKLLPKLKVLKIVDVKLSMDDVIIVKKSFREDTKIILSIPEYFESLKLKY